MKSPCSAVWTNLCIPQAGQFSPVVSLIGHLGQNQYCEGLYLYKISRLIITIINNVYLLMCFNVSQFYNCDANAAP